MATIREVAKKAGVSPITVSRVINNSGYIAPDTRKRVLAAVKKLGYVPNTLARSLRSRHTSVLALILTDVTNPFFTTVVRGVEDAANEAGFNVLLCNTDESVEKQEKYINAILQKQVDGILLVPALDDVGTIRFIRKQSVPLVILDRRIAEANVDTVRCDSEGGAFQIAQLLISLGHRRIGVLSGPARVSTAVDRVSGYRKALREAGIAVDEQLIRYGEFTLESGYEMAKQIMAYEKKPTALFAGNNFIAIGALKALHDLSLRVPEDIAVAGFDDLPVSLIVEPFLTAAAQPAYEMGLQATRLIIDRLKGKETSESKEILLPVELIVRKSSGKPIPVR